MKQKLITIKKKIENYLYHYKWHTLIGGFLLLVLLWTGVSSCQNQGTYVYLGYIGEHPYSTMEQRQLSDRISSSLKIDGKKSDISFTSYYYLTDEQAQQRYDEAILRGDVNVERPVQNMKNYDNFKAQLERGDIGVWLVSKQVYETLDKSRLETLENIFSSLPAAAADEYALDMSKLNFTLRLLGDVHENTYLIIRKARDYSSIVDDKVAQAEVEANRALVRAIVSFK